MASVQLLPPAPAYWPHSSQAGDSVASLPSFTSEVRPNEESLQFEPVENTTLTDHNYVYSSKSITLDLGRRLHGASHPTYGANSEIRGIAELKDLRNVKHVVLKISGKVSYLVLEDGFSSYTQCKTVLRHTQTLFSSTTHLHGQSEIPAFPFSFHIPTYAHQSKAHLPPTVHNSISSDPRTRVSIRLNVRYRIDVEVTRHGLHRHERVGTEWWHAPRTFALPSITRRAALTATATAAWESDVKIPPNASYERESRTVHITTEGSPTSDPELELCPLPFQITVHPHASSVADLNHSAISSLVSLSLVKRVSFELGYTPSDVSVPIAEGRITEVLVAEDGSCIASGTLKLPPLGETSWHMAPFIETSYSLRLAFTPAPNHSGYEAEVTLKLVSDEESALQMEGEEAWARPARSRLEVLEASDHCHRSFIPAALAKLLK
ncbi:hypothetical protein FRB90_003145, partial [Tulasnella sp. 427]